jgi:hypothetical protein
MENKKLLPRFRNRSVEWGIYDLGNGIVNPEDARLAVLMDIRDELKSLNAIFKCKNFQDIPKILRSIQRKRRPGRPRLGSR